MEVAEVMKWYLITFFKVVVFTLVTFALMYGFGFVILCATDLWEFWRGVWMRGVWI